MIEEEILKDLNEKQLEAVTHFTGPIVIIAGAGSGKTRALTHRVAYLIMHHKIAPWNILAVTFTNKAANEMKDRIKKLLGIDENQTGFGAEPTVGTFHSICVRILRKHIHLLDYDSNFTIYDANDQQILMKRVMEELHIDSKKINPKALLAHVSNAKNELIDHEEYRSMASNYFTERVAEVFRPYQDALKKNNALDFDDLIMKTVELFLKHSEILDEYQEKWKFICVDEYQDTNQAQYKLINLLAEKYRNICVIGDSDQSIYSWRGADIRNILDFEKDYTDTKVVKLEQNYRSTQVILDAAHQIIIKNKKRREKRLWTDRKEGESIKIIATNSERHEGETIAENIRGACSGHEAPPYNQFVVLYRTNAQSRVIEEAFLRYGIPYRIVGGIKFYARKEIKDIIAYLRIIQNPHDTVSLLRVINTPARKIGSKTLDAIQTYADLHGFSMYEAMQYAKDIDALNEGKINGIHKFLNIIEQLRDINTKYPAS
ncbi:UvrD-helicase domain-containing protein, partial [Patescibacteria group bacterium]|nr:UvrD-helicase domain-containing protein [Patescibacteria group bacterium]